MAPTGFKVWNTCFVCLLVTSVLASYAQASIFDVDPEVQKRKGGVLNSKKVSLVTAGKVYFHKIHHPMVLVDGKYTENASAYDNIAVCEKMQNGKDLNGKQRTFHYFACPMDDQHTGVFAREYCCKTPPAQECCTDGDFGFENDLTPEKQHKRMIKIVIIVSSVFGSLILICVVGIIICCVGGFIAVCSCCKKAGNTGGGQVRSAGHYPSNQQMAYQNTARPPPQQLNYAANQQPASYQPANQQPANYQAANQQPASYQPANQQPAGYQPANQQPPNYQPTAPYPGAANQAKPTPYPT